MRIVYATTEAIPFARTGGLGDVCGSLPNTVSALGHDVSIFMPAFRQIHQAGISIESTDLSFTIQMRKGISVGCRLLKSHLPGSGVTIWFIDQPKYFDRDQLYGDKRGDYPDNAERFTFFCRAILKAIQRLQLQPDIIHCNDWQTGLLPGLIRHDPDLRNYYENTATVMTIHNLAYQGQFPSRSFEYTGIGWEHFSPDAFEFFGSLNFLKAGVISADTITTVSPQYAKEITSSKHGCGLESVLQGSTDRMRGIINGIDELIWNPATDSLIPANYDHSNWRLGKTQNKGFLQNEFKLDPVSELPMIGLVGRLADQKGWDLILPVIRWHLNEGRPTQWIVLGSGDPALEKELRMLAKQFPSQIAVHIGFSDRHAHLIEAAADLFLMPSHYEPCGLNQLYSLRYGTVPIVNPTGGLADTVTDTTEETINDGTATGFHLQHPDPRSLDEAIGRALELRYHYPEAWSNIVVRGMNQDWTWRRSADLYIECYEETQIQDNKPRISS